MMILHECLEIMEGEDMVRYYSDGVEGLVMRKAKVAVTQIFLRELNPHLGANDLKGQALSFT